MYVCVCVCSFVGERDGIKDRGREERIIKEKDRDRERSRNREIDR